MHRSTANPRQTRPSGSLAALPFALCCGLAACTLQGPAHTTLPATPAHWAHAAADAAPSQAVGASSDAAGAEARAWWAALADPAIAPLIAQAERDAPTLAQAAARIEQAQAVLGSAAAQQRPQLSATLSATRALDSTSLPAVLETSATAGLSASWEIDLFGRLRHGRAAAQARLDAADADARLARLSLETRIADGVVQRRACSLLLDRERASLASASTTLALTVRKREEGFAAPLEVARSRTSVAALQVALASTAGECAQQTEVLAFLSGLDAPAVEAVLGTAGSGTAEGLPEAPPFRPALPASVLAAHPALVAARRSADALYEEIGAARASRLPRLDLAALLNSSRIVVSGLDATVNAWSVTPTLAYAAYDGGAGAAGVAAAEARYREAVAVLQNTLRETVRDVELALIQGRAAAEAAASADGSVEAARELLRASAAAQQAGRLSLFDLETARSALLSAETGLIQARRDRLRAWIALVQATAGGLATLPPL